MRQYVAGNHSESLPTEFFSDQFLMPGIHAGQQYQAPLAGPCLPRLTVDAVGRLLKFLRTFAGQAVVATPADLVDGQPAVARQSENGGANKSFANAEIRHDVDQTADPNRATPWRNGVAEDRCDE